MRRGLIPLLGLLGVVVLLGVLTPRTLGPVLVTQLRMEWRTVELTAAYPALRLDEALTGFSRLSTAAGVRALDAGTSADAWFDQPLAARWTRYTAPAAARVRLFTHIELGVFALGVVALLARTVGRGLWFLLMLLIMRRRARPGTSHGSARWADARELAALRPRPGHADLVVGRVGRHLVAIPEHAQYEHLLLVAPTGAGKTSGVILPNLLAEPGIRSLVITDPKRELLRKSTPTLRSRYGRERVWVLDFLDPTLSRGYNPLAYVTDAASADLFAQTWVRNTGESKDAFWSNAARTLIGAAALHLVATDEIAPPLVALAEFLCGTPAEGVREELAGSPVPEVRCLAHGFLANMSKNERLLGSVFTELPPRFTCLNLPAVRAVTGTNEIDFARFAGEPTALYLALDPQHGRTLAPLTASFFLHFFTTLTGIAKGAAGGALPVPVLAYLDEFGTVGHIPEFASRMATVRSAGIGCLLVVQDLAQLTKSYGAEDADTILSNSTTKLCLGRVTHDDAEYFSKLAGTTTVLSANRSSSRALLVPWADRGNRGSGEAQRALVTPDELRTMRDAVFVVAGHRNPVRARQRRYYDAPALARLVPDLTQIDPLVALRRSMPLPLPVLTAPVASPAAPDPFPAGATMATLATALADHDSASAPATVAPTAVSCAPAAPGATAAPPINFGPDAPAPALALPTPDTITSPVSPVVLTPSQRRLLATLATMPAASSSALAAALGVQRSTVRDGLMRIRRALDVGQEADLVATARERGLLPVAVPSRPVMAEETDSAGVAGIAVMTTEEE